MKKRTAVLFVLTGMLLSACNPFKSSKPIETFAAVTIPAAKALESKASRETADAPSRTEIYQASKKRDIALTLVNTSDNTSMREIGSFIPREDIGNVPSGLHHYGSLSFYMGNSEWYVDLHTSAMPEPSGEFAFDDSNRFFIRICSASDQYVIFDDQVQLGIPEVDVFDDADGNLHVVLKDIRSAYYEISDFTYDIRSYGFNRNTLIKEEAVNYIGSY